MELIIYKYLLIWSCRGASTGLQGDVGKKGWLSARDGSDVQQVREMKARDGNVLT